MKYTEKNKTIPKYNMWQNTGFMVNLAWKNVKSVIFICIVLAIATAGKTVAGMLITPMILKKVESMAPLSELIITILSFSLGIMFLSAAESYFNENSLFGRIEVRSKIINKISLKNAKTSYPNLMDENFNNLREKASNTTSSNNESTEYIWTTLTNIITNCLGFIFYLALLSGLNPLLALIVVITTVIDYFINKKVKQYEYDHRAEFAEINKKLNYTGSVQINRDYGKEIRLFGLKTWLDDLWQSLFNLLNFHWRKLEKVYFYGSIANVVLTFLRNGIAYAYLIWVTLNREMTASEFLLYFSTVGGFANWVTGILDEFAQLHKESLDISIVREFLEYPEPFKFEEGEPLVKDLNKEYEITLENVSYRYPKAEKDTIHNMNLTIHKGEKLAIVGLNGAGKTTLVKLACGFLDPTEGRVLLNGEDIRKYNRHDYYEMFSAVFQDFSLMEATVIENIAQTVSGFDEKLALECLDKAGLTQKIHSLPQGINTHIGREVYLDGVELSGGQVQRLMLARALYKNGPILVLDEPTAALDPIAENDIYMKYNEMTKGKTSLFISHRLASTRFCDRIIFLKDGNISEEGTHEELLKLKGDYAELFDVQRQYYK